MPKPKENDKYPSKKAAGDAAHALVKAAISAIPVLGGAGVELFQNLVAPPLEKRRTEWMGEVGERLRVLERDRGVKIDDLRDNPEFIDTVMSASLAALRTSQLEKREALRNAIINSALPEAPSSATRHLFVQLIDSFTEWHLRILRLFQNPEAELRRLGRGQPRYSAGGLDVVIEHAYPELIGQKDLYEQIWRDLYSNGLLNTPTPHGTQAMNGLMAKRTTDYGDTFLTFIQEPA